MLRKPKVESLAHQIALARKSLSEWPAWLREASGMKPLPEKRLKPEPAVHELSEIDEGPRR